MTTPLTLFPGQAVILPPRLLGTAAYYATMLAYEHPVVDTALRFNKRAKSVHRYDIADVRGSMALTVPIVHASGSARWRDVAVSRHGDWWRLHRTAWESAYGRTPFFEFLIDRFDSVLADPGDDLPVTELIARADSAVLGCLHLDCGLIHGDAPADAVDLRAADFSCPAMPPHFQVRQASLGFIANLSILDLLFNLGSDAAIYLKHLIPLIFNQQHGANS